MFESLLAFLRDCREPMTASGLWADLACIRANGSPCVDLPATEAEMSRMLRHAKVAGLVAEEEGKWRVLPQAGRKGQGELFSK